MILITLLIHVLTYRSSMKVSVLASGSKGNCTYIETNKHHILVDIGTSSLSIEKKLKAYNIDPKLIDSVFVTHAHSDHVSGINVFWKKYHPTVYLTDNIYKEANLNIKDYINLDGDIELDDLKVITIPTSHDAKDSRGYIFESDGKSVVYMTDTGYISEKYHKLLSNRTLYIMESNHDVELLMNNEHYPHHVKIRILGDEGHLSNKDSANYLAKFIGKDTKKVFLAHLSEENNTPDIAYLNLKHTLEKKNITFDNIGVASQKEATELLEL